MLCITPEHWLDYELIDSGDFQKLERFGEYIINRPEPQAVWGKTLSNAEWNKMTDITFTAKSSNSGTWTKRGNIPESWNIQYSPAGLTLKMKLTAFKHVGVFPEQAVNWDYIASKIDKCPVESPKVLNLFAYTGAASVVAQKSGALATHIDSVKQVVNWSKENMVLSDVENIRWIIEDARKFVAKEVKRGNKYNGIIMDPPAFGRGAKGESWKLEEDLYPLLKDVQKLLDDKHFFILNTYSLGFSSIILENLINQIFTHKKHEEEIGELYLQETKGKKKLPLGVFARFATF